MDDRGRSMPFLLPLTSVSIPRGLPSIPSLKFIFRSYVGYTTRSVSVYFFAISRSFSRNKTYTAAAGKQGFLMRGLVELLD